MRVVDHELDDRIWMGASVLAGNQSREALLAMPACLRWYYVTRAFEWLSMSGVDEFWNDGYVVIAFVGEGYLELGLPDAARAYEHLRESGAARRLLEDTADDDDFSCVEAMTRRVGRHDARRLEYLQSYQSEVRLVLRIGDERIAAYRERGSSP